MNSTIIPRRRCLRFHSLLPSPPPIWMLMFLITTLISFTFLAEKVAVADPDSGTTRDYIVFTDQPQGQVDLRDYALHILTPVLGSKEAAVEALGYVYRNVGPGFSARLTPKQALELQHEPGVLYVKESELYQPQTGGVALSI